MVRGQLHDPEDGEGFPLNRWRGGPKNRKLKRSGEKTKFVAPSGIELPSNPSLFWSANFTQIQSPHQLDVTPRNISSNLHPGDWYYNQSKLYR